LWLLSGLTELTNVYSIETPKYIGVFIMLIDSRQKQLLKEILASINGLPDAPVKEILSGDHLVAIKAEKVGICTRISHHGEKHQENPYRFAGSAFELASMLTDPPEDNPDSIAYSFAAVNSLLPIPENAFPLKAQDLLIKHGKGKNAVIIGHFPFVEKSRAEFSNLWVIEMNPRPGDFPSDKAAEILPLADVVAITATTLLNGTCAEILGRIPENAFTIMLGPSTPFAPCLFDWGINALAGCGVTDPAILFSGIKEGLSYRQVEGIRPLIWMP
jgi:hypothetical protein